MRWPWQRREPDHTDVGPLIEALFDEIDRMPMDYQVSLIARLLGGPAYAQFLLHPRVGV